MASSNISVNISLLMLTLFVPELMAQAIMPLPLETVEKLEAQQQRAMVYTKQAIEAFPPLEDDIKSLSDQSNAQPVMQRIIARGEVSTPYLMTVIKNPESSYQLKAIALSLMYQVANSEHISFIIQATELIEAEQRNSGKVSTLFPYAYTFQWLETMPSNELTIKFVNKQLADSHRDPAIKALALKYLAIKPDKQSMQWFKQYAAPESDKQLQYATYYLGAMLGVESVKNNIIDLLKSMPVHSSAYKQEGFNLLKGLAELTTLDEFKTLTKQNNINISDENIQRYLLIKRDNSEQKTAIINKALSKRGTEAGELIDYLININDAEPLAIHWQVNNPWLRQMLKKRQLAIQVNQQEVKFIPFIEYKISKQAITTPEQLARAVFKTLKNNKQADFISLTTNDTRLFIMLEVKQNPSPGDAWQQIKQQGESAGVNWKTAELVSTHHQIMVTKNRLQIADIEVVITSNKSQYKFVISGSLYFDDQWRIAFPLQWRGIVS